MQSLHESLNKYEKSNILPMHMPGHKRRSDILPDWNLWEMDFTEVFGLDNLYEAEGIIKAATDRLAATFGVKKSYMLVNGSTGGLLTAISACVSHGDTILVARNCHKSVYNAAYLNELKCEYVYPEVLSEWDIYGGVTPKAVKAALEAKKNIRAVVITSPTYEGIVSDISAIAKVVHEYKIPLIVDEAHGAHFKFIEACPKSAVDCGQADIVVQSFHKLLPALTQTAVMHVVSDEFIDMDRLSRYYSMYQTSSPSYLFMASIDYAREFMEREKTLEKKYFKALEEIKEKLEALKNISIMKREVIGSAGVYALDPTKLFIACRRGVFSGAELEDMLLSDYNIQVEMSKGKSVLLMTSIIDDAEVLDKVYEAFCDIDKRCEAVDKSIRQAGGRDESVNTYKKEHEYRAVSQMTCHKAMNSPVREVMVEEAEGFISAEYVCIYPPGVPVLVPGELITAEVVKILCYYREEYQKKEAKAQRRLQGLSDKSAKSILVVDKP